MAYGWAGTNLEVDLSQGKIRKEESDPKLLETYLGGKGTGVKLLWDRVLPEVTPFSPSNLLIIGASVLTGTIVPGANRVCFTFKSPVTDSLSYSSVGGLLAAELRRAGYDTIVISGKSPTPVYLWISDDHVEIRDASYLWGKDTRETQRLIREELKIGKLQIACIGQAGENRVYTASIEHSTGVSASRAGVGAIMGDKNLKAIAVRGTRDIDIAKGSKFGELCEQILSKGKQVRTEYFQNYSDSFPAMAASGAPYGNLGEAHPPELRPDIENIGKTYQDFVERKRIRAVGCHKCPLRCKHTYPCPDGGYSIIKCASWVMPMIASKMIDFDFTLIFHDLCEKYGLDIKATANDISFAIDLYEKGILTKGDTDGMHLEWRNDKVVLWLVERIARRQGIGDILANGLYRAARQIGRGAEQYAYHTKKLEIGFQPPLAPSPALRHAVSDKAQGIALANFTSMISRRPKEEREAHIKSGFFSYPQNFGKYFLADDDRSGADYEGICQCTAYDEETWALIDSAGLCSFWVVRNVRPPISSRALIADLVSCVTGMDIDEAGITETAKRIVCLTRAYHVRSGIRRKDDSVPEILFQRTPPPPLQKLDHGRFNEWIDRFYEIKGYNSEGIPTKETLDKLGLDYVRQDLQRREILTG